MCFMMFSLLYCTVLVELTNSMFSQLHVEQRVQHWSDINAHVFVTLFEGINGEPLRGNVAVIVSDFSQCVV